MKNTTAIIFALIFANEASALNLIRIPESRAEISEELVLSQMSHSFPSCEFRSWGPALLFNFAPLKAHFAKKSEVQREYDAVHSLIEDVVFAAAALKNKMTELHPYIRLDNERDEVKSLLAEMLKALRTVKDAKNLGDQLENFGNAIRGKAAELQERRREEQRIADLIDQKKRFLVEMQDLQKRYQKAEPALSLNAAIDAASSELAGLERADQVSKLRENFLSHLYEEREVLRQERHTRERRMDRVDRENLNLVLKNFYEVARVHVRESEALKGIEAEVSKESLSKKLGSDDLDQIAKYLYFEYRLAQRLSGSEAIIYRIEMNLRFLRRLNSGSAQARDLQIIRVARRSSHAFRKAELFAGLLGNDLKIERDLGAREREILVSGALTHIELYSSLVVGAQKLVLPQAPLAPTLPSQTPPKRPPDPPSRVSSYSERDRIREQWRNYRDQFEAFRQKGQNYNRDLKKFKELAWPQYQTEAKEYRILLARKQRALQVLAFYLLAQLPDLGSSTVAIEAALKAKSALIESAVRKERPKQSSAQVAAVARRPQYQPQNSAHAGDTSGGDFFWWWYLTSQDSTWSDAPHSGLQQSFHGFPNIAAEAWDAVGLSQATGTGWLQESAPALEGPAELSDLSPLHLDLPHLENLVDPQMPDLQLEMPDLPDVPEMSIPDLPDTSVDVDVGSDFGDAGDAGDGGGGDGGGGD